jgi:hypothetical protein
MRYYDMTFDDIRQCAGVLMTGCEFLDWYNAVT